MDPKPTAPIVARPSHHWRDYRAKRLAITLMLVGMGGWFAYDGFVAWPRQNEKIERLKKDKEAAGKAENEAEVRRLDAELGKLTFHNDTDIMVQKALAFSLPPLGLLVLAWSLYNSRGQYRLENNVIHAPGHPPVPLDAITAIDKTDWDRKGIADIEYELPTHAKGTLRLDDFIYDRDPTDAIFKRVEEYARGANPASDAATTPNLT